MLSFFKSRRGFIYSLLSGAAAWLSYTTVPKVARLLRQPRAKDAPVIKESFALDLHFPTLEPFLFCAHHDDQFPKGTAQFGPEPKWLSGREIGADFNLKDGFRMYHGDVVPGFPVHPHRGFETITIVRRGFVDHSDSMGAAGRYGNGDVQWLTAGAGIQHCEMLPLLHADQANPTELFQIWLNLPRRNKLTPPHYTMFWGEDIPRVAQDGGRVTVTVIAGAVGDAKPLSPPPESWAADPANEVAVLLVKFKANGTFTLPKAGAGVNRSVYFFAGSDVTVNGEVTAARRGFVVDAGVDLNISAGADDAEVLVLQAKPIGEPIVQRGPFVMNTPAEITETITTYQRTQFGGWPWPREDMVHGAKIERFAKYPDGRVEKRPVT